MSKSTDIAEAFVREFLKEERKVARVETSHDVATLHPLEVRIVFTDGKSLVVTGLFAHQIKATMK